MSLSSIRKTLRSKAVVVPAVGAAVLFGGVACGEESAGPDESTTLEDINENEEPLEEDEGLLEEDEGLGEDEIAEAPNPGDFDDDSETFFADREALLNENVTVSGLVVEVFNPNAFVIGEDELATLVVTDPSVELTPEVGKVAQVTGDVGTFVLVDVEEQFGFDLADEDFVDFEQAPFIASDNVNVLDQEG